MHKPKLILVVIDGWGYSTITKGNAVLAAKKPNFNYLWSHYAHTLLNSYGENVGLPWGAIGSSEVGHTSMGSGKLAHQELSLIDKEVNDRSFNSNKMINEFVDRVKKTGTALHLIGLVSNGGVHSDMTHLFAILKLLKRKKFVSPVYIHAITDGRDTSPESAVKYISDLEREISRVNLNARISTITGRYYAMDRDNHWDRTKKAYLAMTEGIGIESKSVEAAIKSSYSKKITDEFIEPVVIHQGERRGILDKLLKKPVQNKSGLINKDNGILFFNIRPDRMRQLTEMFLFKRTDIKTEPVQTKNVLTLTTYNEFLPVAVAYPAEKIKNPLAKLLSDQGYSQGHFAETEKYAHVTYFFNGGNSKPFPKEIWELVPSPQVKTYDLKPEMSANEVTNKVFEILEQKNLDFILINYANADMVGHTGIYNKVVKAVEAVDKEIGRLMKLLPETTLIITADHGNAECMINPKTGEIDKRHTVNPVPFILVNDQFKKETNPNESIKPLGILADIAPTVLQCFDIKKPAEMNGISLTSTLLSNK